MIKNKLIVLLSMLILMIWLPFEISAQEASFYVLPESGSCEVGQSFRVDVLINSEGVSLNASQATIHFPTDKLKVIDISKNNSIFSLWTQEPVWLNSQGTISFGGGLPNPGFRGSAGKVISITFQGKLKGEARIYFKEEAILANDAWGTNIFSFSREGNYSTFNTKLPEVEKVPEVKIESISVPEITVCPSLFTSGEEVMYVEGTALPDCEVLVFFKKNEQLIKEWQVVSNETGDWFVAEDDLIRPGLYKITARTKDTRGAISQESSPCFVKVILSGVAIGPWIIAYKALALILLTIFMTILCGTFYLLLRIRKIQRLIEKEAKDLKEKFYKEYHELQADIEAELEELKIDRGKRKMTKEEERRKEELLKNLNDVKDVFEKELKDIEKIK